MIRLTRNGGVSLRALAIGLVMFAPLAASAADAGFTDRIIVKYRTQAGTAGTNAEQMRGTELPAARLGVSLNRLRTTALGSQVLKVDRRLSLAEAESLAADIAASDPNVEYAEPDRIMRKVLTPNDTRYNEQWHYFEAAGGINAPPAWDKSTGSGVIVGVVDTGYRPHADLNANILPGYDFISDTFVANDGNGRDNSALDPGDWVEPGECGPGDPAAFEASSWHGTHVAGTVAAITNNSNGVAGIAFNARVVPARVLGKCGGFTSDIADAIIWVTGGRITGVPDNANRAKVVSISLGGSGACGTTTQSAINSARRERRVRDRRGRQQQRQCGQFLAGELLRCRDGRSSGPQRRQGVVLELRRDSRSGGAGWQWRSQQRAVDSECRASADRSRTVMRSTTGRPWRRRMSAVWSR